jgi:hypothetical protein
VIAGLGKDADVDQCGSLAGRRKPSGVLLGGFIFMNLQKV